MLIIGLPDTADTANTDAYEHARFGEDARLISQGLLSVAEWPAGPLVAVLPLSRLSWHSVRLPDLPKAQRLPAVIGLLEDQWLQSPASLHLSLHPIEGAAPDQPNFWVCACDAQWLDQALQALIKAGRMPQRLFPEWAPTNIGQAETLHVWGSAEHAQLTWCNAQGVLWSHWPNPWPLLQSTPVTVWAEPAVLELTQKVWSADTHPVRTQTRAERWWAATQSGFDMAQGAWSQTPSQRWQRSLASAWREAAHHPRWRWSRRALGLLLLTQSLGLLGWAWWAEQAMASQQRELASMLTQAFPQTQLVVDPAAQMNQALQKLRRQVGAPTPDQAEVMLGRLSQTLPQAPELTRLRFEGQSLTLEGLRLDAIDAAGQQRLRQLGYDLQAQPDGLIMRWRAQP